MFLNVPLCSSLPDCRLVSATNVITKVTDLYHSLAQFKGALNLPSSLTTTWAVPEPFPESTPSFSDRMVIPTAVHGVKQSSVFVHPSLIRWSSRVNSDHADGSGTQRLARERREAGSGTRQIRGVWIEYCLHFRLPAKFYRIITLWLFRYKLLSKHWFSANRQAFAWRNIEERTDSVSGCMMHGLVELPWLSSPVCAYRCGNYWVSLAA